MAKKCCGFVLLLALLIPTCGQALAGLGPENVAVVINEDSWASKTVANEFIALHGVPPCNVVYLKDLPDFEQVDVECFRTRILSPVLATLTQRGLAGQIDCIAYAPDLPATIDTTKDFPKPPRAQIGARASLTGLTYLYSFTLAGLPGGSQGGPQYVGNVNTYFRPLIRPKRPIELTPAQAEDLGAVRKLLHDEKWKEALEKAASLGDATPNSPEVQNLLAVCLARNGEPEKAVAALRRAADAGWLQWRQWQVEKAFAPLLARKEFQDIIAQVRAIHVDVMPTMGFRNAYGWNQRHERVAPDKGARFMLSVMLGATSGRGNSVEEALASLRRSAAATASAAPGTFYFMQNDNIRSVVRDWLYPSVVAKLRDEGKRAEVIEWSLPQKKNDVAGAMIGAEQFNWPASGSAILPGAVCEHFTSYGGMLAEGAGQTPLTAFLTAGAAGASGTVTEPYAIAEKFPSPFLHLHYSRGCTLAEAFYQSVARPYELLIVGDPLCAPWARRPLVTVTGVTAGQTLKGPFELKPVSPSPAAVAVEHFEIFLDGVRRAVLKPGDTLKSDAAKLPDGGHEIRVVAVAATPLEERGETLTLPVQVENTARPWTVTAPEGKPWPWDRPIIIKAALRGAAAIRLEHNAREIGAAEGDSATFQIDPLRLGAGACRVQCVALDAEPSGHGTPAAPGRRVIAVSAPIALEIVAPAPLPAVDLPAGAALANGLLLTIADEPGVAIAGTAKRDWLRSAGLKEGQAFTLEGYLDAPDEGVNQFQVRGNVQAVLELDGRPLRVAEGDRPRRAADQLSIVDTAAPWHFLPVALGRGIHRLAVRGVGAKDSALDIRFGPFDVAQGRSEDARTGGRQGARHIGPGFRHVPPEEQ